MNSPIGVRRVRRGTSYLVKIGKIHLVMHIREEVLEERIVLPADGKRGFERVDDHHRFRLAHVDVAGDHLRDASKRLEEEYPNHPVTSDVEETLSRSQPPSVDEVKRLLDEAESLFEVDERLAELADELQAEYPGHGLTAEVVDTVEGSSSPNDEHVGELIEKAEQLLEGVDEQLRRIRKTMDELSDGSVVVIDSLD